MPAPAEDSGSGNPTMKPDTASQGKKAYSAPRLVDYGDLRRLTAGSGGTKGDNNPPGGKSKT